MSAYIWNQGIVQAILNDVKKVLSKLIIVCGGPDISWNSQEWLTNYPDIDFIIQGAGEKSFKLLHDNDFKYHNKVINKENFCFDEIGFPYMATDGDLLKNKYIYYEASRGCPFKCSYCVSSRADQNLQFKAIEKVKAELLVLLEFQPVIIKFIDRSFNVNNELAMQIWSFITNLDTKTKFHFEIHPLYLNQDQLNVLKLLPDGLVQLEVGIQTVKDSTLEKINRIGKWDKIQDQLKKLSELKNIHQHFDMIAGLPSEDYADMKNSFDTILKLKPDHFQPGFLKILPGTMLEEKKNEWGYKFQKYAPYRVFSSDSISFTDLNKVELMEMALDLVYNSKVMPCFISTMIEKTDAYSEYFFSLGSYFKEAKINKSVSDKKKLYQFTREHFEKYFVREDMEFFLDCLRYDWFILSNTHYYPEFLEANHCDEFKSDIYNLFKKSWQEMNLQNPNDYKEKLRNVSFFSPKDSNFKIQMIEQADGAVNVNQKNLYLIVKKGNNLIFK